MIRDKDQNLSAQVMIPEAELYHLAKDHKRIHSFFKLNNIFE